MHASKLEARRCNELSERQAVGIIANLEQQPEYPLVVNDQPICRYVADFRYQMADSGLSITEDVKGKPTRDFVIKRKLVEALYPGVVVSLWPPKKRKARRKKAA